ADAPSGVALNSPISVTFNKPAQSITTNTLNNTCSGSLEVSSDNFATCVQMGGAAATSGGNTTFTVTPNAPLSGNATYKLRVTTLAQDSSGVALASQFTQAAGFTTQPALAVSSTSPTDGATGVPVGSAISVTFNKAVTPGSITTNTGSPVCLGTLQVSSDNFTSCVQMNAVPAASGGNTIF